MGNYPVSLAQLGPRRREAAAFAQNLDRHGGRTDRRRPKEMGGRRHWIGPTHRLDQHRSHDRADQSPVGNAEEVPPLRNRHRPEVAGLGLVNDVTKLPHLRECGGCALLARIGPP